MNKRAFEDTEAEEDPTVDTEEDLTDDDEPGHIDREKGKEKVDKSLPPKKRQKKKVRTRAFQLHPRDHAAQLRQMFDAMNVRIDKLEAKYIILD